jgi:hypothetical protein
MKTLALAIAAAALIASPALAQNAAPAPAAAAAAPAGKLSVETTPIGDIIKNPQAKAALEKALPEIADYYSQISGMSLAEVAPLSEGVINAAKLREIQAEFDKIG